jgi:AcrR family transcriptional regulator
MAKKAKRRAASAKASRANPSSSSPEDRVIDAALALADGQSWRSLTLAEIAGETGLSLGELYGLFPSKAAILSAFVRRIDRATMAGVDFATDDDAGIRDRLFDIFMRRFDALAPYKGALGSILAELPRDPLSLLCSGTQLLHSIAWMAAAAGVQTGGLLGPLRVKALAGIYAYVMRVWINDDGDDNAKTMAALDRALKQAEMFARSLPRRRAAQASHTGV